MNQNQQSFIEFILNHKNVVIWSGLGVLLILAVLITWVFPGKIILSQQIQIGSFAIHYYGLILITAVLSAYALAVKNSIGLGLTKAQIENIMLSVIIVGFIGARAYHVFSDFDLYRDNYLNVFAVWQGGLSIFGAVIGGLLGLYLFQLISKSTLPLLKILDWLVPSVLLGQIIGRFGNLFNYEAYGLPTNLPWKMFVPLHFRDSAYFTSTFYHPLFLYEALLGLLLLVALVYLVSIRDRLKIGLIFTVWLFGYGLIRLGTEILRVDLHTVFGIRINIITSGLMVLSAVILYLYITKPFNKNDEKLYSA